VIRLANQDDLPILREMIYEAECWDSDRSRPSMDEVLQDPKIAAYVEDWLRPGDAGLIAAEDETFRPLGAAWYRLFTAERCGYGFVDEQTPELAIAVIEEFRGRHIGSALIEGLKRHAKAQGHQRLSLAVEPKNLRARLLYAKTGFREIREDGDLIVMMGNVDTTAAPRS
jgi:ribosomal protein S18 acetylase RimI-like enzyme